MSTGKPGLGLILWNLVSLNLGWWSSVLSAANGYPWIGPVVITALVGIHLTLIPHRRREVAILAAAGVFGYAVDSILVLAGAIDFPAASQLGWPSTVWMVALWVNLATAFNLALYWLVGKPRLGAVLGAVGGPIAYLGGWKLGSLSAPAGPGVLAAAVAVQWAITTPLVLTGVVRIARAIGPPVPTEAGGSA